MSKHFSDPSLNNAPHFVRLVGQTSRIVGADTIEEAQADAAERNKRAEEFGIKARYEAVSK